MKGICLFILLFSPLCATEYAPWFSPLWELQGRISYSYDKQHTVQSPKGNIRDHNNEYTIQSSLGVTPWPYWNAEIELYLTHTNRIPFSYEALFGTLRYQWLDDIRGDPIALVTGVTFSFPGNRYLHDYNFPYHGDINGELHFTVGKEWACEYEWWMRMWAFGGWGIANRGNGWLHGIGVIEFQPLPFQWGVYTEALCGLGSNDIIAADPFEGYASINHQNVDIGGYFSFPVNSYGMLTFQGWYNAYARNYIQHYWGLGLSLQIPFSL